MLSNREVEQYRELGYLVVPDVLDAPMLAEVRRMVDGIVADAGKVATHTEVYDLEGLALFRTTAGAAHQDTGQAFSPSSPS